MSWKISLVNLTITLWGVLVGIVYCILNLVFLTVVIWWWFWLHHPQNEETAKYPGWRGGGASYNGLHREALPEKGSFAKLELYKRVGISRAEVWTEKGVRKTAI